MPISTEKQTETLQGQVERVTFHSPESGFCVLRAKVKGHKDLVTVVGHAAIVLAGEHVDCKGFWVNDREHGLQFKAEAIRSIPPSTLEGMEKYLGSGLIKGIGPHFAGRLVKSFGETVFEIIENEPERLLQVEGIGKTRVAKISQGWREQKIVREIMVFLQSHGVGTMRAVRIYKTYGEEAIDTVRQNPYRLAADIRGIGFKTADQLAQRLGIDTHSMIRARAGINHVLLERSGEGHCAYPRQLLIEESVKLLAIPETIIEQAIEAELAGGHLVSETFNEACWLYLNHLYRAEVELAKHLKTLSQGKHPLMDMDVASAMGWVEQQTGLSLAPSQRASIEMAVQNKVMIITGGPGVGKTTLINSILKIFQAKKLRCLLCAPTGRAAKRMAESTGMAAKTIHRLLAFDPKTAQFKHNRENRLPCDVLVVDECSMVDLVLMNKLIQSIPNEAVLLLVGDVDQLPSVGPGNVLSDLISSSVLAVARLTEVFRQAAQSRIITNAHRVNQGQMPDLKEPESGITDFYFIEANEPEQLYNILFRLVKERIPKRFQLNSIEDIQVLTPMNRSGLGARALNVELQKAMNPRLNQGIERFGTRFACGDKVMQTQNNYEKEVFNGDIGVIHALNETEREVTVHFEGRAVTYDFDELDELSLAYACTIHKSQGSEYPAIILVLHTQHYQMLQRNLLYTGMTRGKKLVIVLGSKKALWIALKRAESMKRYSRLKERLQGLPAS